MCLALQGYDVCLIGFFFAGPIWVLIDRVHFSWNSIQRVDCGHWEMVLILKLQVSLIGRDGEFHKRTSDPGTVKLIDLFVHPVEADSCFIKTFLYNGISVSTFSHLLFPFFPFQS